LWIKKSSNKFEISSSRSLINGTPM
jgi:hypothetical protein